MQTLGDVITAMLILAALIVVPYKIVKAWLWPVARDSLMSRSANRAPEKTDIDAVSVPVPDTSIIPDSMPRVSAYLTDEEWLILLARQKLRDGKYRLSANEVYRIVGGNRNDVLGIVRQLRETAQYRQPDETTAPATYPVTR
ncbi:MAG TPA: hypothetical protein VNM70_19450 [Burkholderiales bacterium]|nr:hypothetical protein [Burkholderiales bacterium]